MSLCVIDKPAGTRRPRFSFARPSLTRVWPPHADLAPYARAIARGRSVISLLDRLSARDLVRRHPAAAGKRVTVVVPMWNAAAYIERCVKSLLVQSHRALQILCVDDHSGDDSYPRVVDQFGADRRVNVVRLARNVGPYQIKNWAVRQKGCADLVAMQDADDVSHPERIERQVAAMESARAEVCGTSVHQFFPAGLAPFFGDGRALGPDRDNFMHSIATYSSVAPVDRPVPFSAALGRRQDFVAKHGSQLFRRRVLLEFGGFDGRTRFGADTDLNWRILRFLPILNLPEVLYSRRHHPRSLTRASDTGFGSSARRAYTDRRDREHEDIRRAMESGDRAAARRLCTRECYAGDVAVEAAHLNWSVA